MGFFHVVDGGQQQVETKEWWLLIVDGQWHFIWTMVLLESWWLLRSSLASTPNASWWSCDEMVDPKTRCYGQGYGYYNEPWSFSMSHFNDDHHEPWSFSIFSPLAMAMTPKRQAGYGSNWHDYGAFVDKPTACCWISRSKSVVLLDSIDWKL